MDFRSALAVVMLTSAIASGADATIIRAEISGMIDFGYDGTGLFGSPATDLAHTPFIANFTVNTNKGSVNHQFAFDQLYGYGYDSPVFARLTINGITRSISGNAGSEMIVSKRTYLSQDGHLSYAALDQRPDSLNTYLENSISLFTNVGFPIKFDTEIPRMAVDLNGSAQFQYYRFGGRYDPVDFGVYFSGPGTIQAAIPEPQAWMLLITGFGLTGFMMRRQVAHNSVKSIQ